MLLNSNLLSQQIYPVSINGVLIPPHSLSLNDYTNARASDLFFNVQLIDPVEAFVPIRFRLTIVNNGQEILQTDPSYLPMPRRLNQFQPEVIDGRELAAYLNRINLIGNGGPAQNDLIPEGINQICLEVIHDERGLPISRKACVLGNFRLNEPPLLQRPNCGDEIFLTETNNLFFNWMPLHLGSGNAPIGVAYGFELIELNPGIADPNDGFRNGLKILNTTVMGTTFIYDETQPYLEPGRTYAWRVQAKDISGSELFINKGYSKVCTFTYGGAPKRQVSRSCEPYETDYGNIPAGRFGSSEIQTGQLIDIGFFEMEVINLSGGGSGGYSGEGKVSIPFLNSHLLVNFADLQINEAERVFAVGKIQAISSTDVSGEGVDNLKSLLADYLPKAISEKKLVSQRNSNDPDPIDLPLLLDKETSANANLPKIILTDIRFTEKTANLSANVIQNNLDGSPILFSKVDIPFTPYGVSKASILPLETTLLVESSTKHQLLYLGKEEDRPQTLLDFDCEGFVEYQLKGQYQYDKSIFHLTNSSEEEVHINYATTSPDFNNYIAEVTSVPAFQITGNETYQFELGKGIFDYSAVNNPANLDFPTELNWENEVGWQGFVFSQFLIKVPNLTDFTGTERAVELTEGQLFLTENGISGEALGEGILKLEEGKIRDWNISIEEIGLLYKENELEGKKVKGQIKIPIIDEPFAYEGITTGEKMETSELKIITEENYVAGMSLWNATLDFNKPASEIELTERSVNNEKELIPYADLHGELNVSFSPEEFKNYLKQQDKEAMVEAIKTGLGLQNEPDIELKDLPLKGLIIDPCTSFEDRYRLDDYEIENSKILIGGKSFKVESVYVAHQKDKQNQAELGLNLIVKQGKVLMSLTIWAKENTDNSFTLDRIELESKELDCDCI
jgi:hypothetical protein